MELNERPEWAARGVAALHKKHSWRAGMHPLAVPTPCVRTSEKCHHQKHHPSVRRHAARAASGHPSGGSCAGGAQAARCRNWAPTGVRGGPFCPLVSWSCGVDRSGQPGLKLKGGGRLHGHGLPTPHDHPAGSWTPAPPLAGWLVETAAPMISVALLMSCSGGSVVVHAAAQHTAWWSRHHHPSAP